MEDLKRIFKFMKPCRREFFLAVMFVIIEASFELTIPMLMADMIDVGVADRDMDYIVARGLTMIACALFALVTSVRQIFGQGGQRLWSRSAGGGVSEGSGIFL